MLLNLLSQSRDLYEWLQRVWLLFAAFTTLIFVVLSKKSIEVFFVEAILQLFFLIYSIFLPSYIWQYPISHKEIFSACADKPYVHTPELIHGKSFLRSGRQCRALLATQAGADMLGETLPSYLWSWSMETSQTKDTSLVFQTGLVSQWACRPWMYPI